MTTCDDFLAVRWWWWRAHGAQPSALCTYTHRTYARIDLEEAKREEREDVDSPPGDRDRVARRDAASCCRSTVSGSLKVSPYRRWTESDRSSGGLPYETKSSARALCRCCFSSGRFATVAGTIMQLKKAMLKIFDQCKSRNISFLHGNLLLSSPPNTYLGPPDFFACANELESRTARAISELRASAAAAAAGPTAACVRAFLVHLYAKHDGTCVHYAATSCAAWAPFKGPSIVIA